MPTPLRKRAVPRETPVVFTEARGREIVYARSEQTCEISVPGLCERRAASVHHRLKRSAGGTWAPSNLLAACGSGTTGCHGWVEAHPAAARSLGLWLMRGDGAPDEALVTMVWFGQRMQARLDDDGTVVPVEWLDNLAWWWPER